MDKDTKIEPRVWPTRGSNVRRRCSFVLQINDNHYALHFALAFVASCAVNALVKPFANEVRNDVPHNGCSDGKIFAGQALKKFSACDKFALVELLTDEVQGDTSYYFRRDGRHEICG